MERAHEHRRGSSTNPLLSLQQSEPHIDVPPPLGPKFSWALRSGAASKSLSSKSRHSGSLGVSAVTFLRALILMK